MQEMALNIPATAVAVAAGPWDDQTEKDPEDVLMATYFLRETDHDKCTGCGQCVKSVLSSGQNGGGFPRS